MAKGDYSQPGDPYHITEYSAQSAADEPSFSAPQGSGVDGRGNSQVVVRNIPTQEEADRIKLGK